MYLYKRQQRLNELLETYKSQWLESEVDGPKFIQNVVDCVHQHLFDERLSVLWIKERCILDTIDITVPFKFYVGQTPQSYWIGHRLQAAKILLKDEILAEVPVGDIAFNLGYGTHAAFTIAFKNITDRSPTAFRDRHIALKEGKVEREVEFFLD